LGRRNIMELSVFLNVHDSNPSTSS
jgi:hypothetical protein